MALRNHTGLGLSLLAVGLTALAACSSSSSSGSTPATVASAGSGGSAGAAGKGGGTGIVGSGGAGGKVLQLGSASDPATCDDAMANHSYVGCDFWPTVTFNPVWSLFDFAVVVANVGAQPADISVTGGLGSTTVTVPPLSLAKVYLPWVPDLKGKDADPCGSSSDQLASVVSKKGAYHLTSTRPVIVYQFNALEFRGAGGPQGKDWGSCPGLSVCSTSKSKNGCYSFTNDAALLLPSTAMTGNYAVTSLPGGNSQGFFAVTATQDATTVTMKLGAAAKILAGGTLTAGNPGALVKLTLDAGDVAEIVGNDTSDLGGTLVQADHPVQVISGSGCAAIPPKTMDGTQTTCDHIEETVLPVETLGKHYFVTSPTGALGKPVPHAVRLYGGVTDVQLTYPAGMPAGAPATLAAGKAVDLGVLSQDFEIVGDNAFSVGLFQLSAQLADPNDIIARADPSQSQAVTVDQYRTGYVFLAPDDYDVSFVDVIMPMKADVQLDGVALPVAPQPIGSSGYGVARVRLGIGEGGAHSLAASQPVGIQVMGYGAYTGYQFPGGLNLQAISPPLPILQ